MPDAKIIRLHDHRTAPKPDGVGDQETIGSIIARRRHALGYPERNGKRRLGSVAMRKALREIRGNASMIECAILWLGQVVKDGHDPRAIAVYVDELDWHKFDRADLTAATAAFDAVMVEMLKRLPPDIKPVPPCR